MSIQDKCFLEARKIIDNDSLLLETVMQSMGDGLSIQDVNLRIVYQNQFMIENFGSHIGEHCYKIYEMRDSICRGCPVTRAFETGEVCKAIRVGITKDGKSFRFENIASPLRNEEGEIVAGMELCRIVEEREKAIDDLRLTMEDLDRTKEKLLIENNVRMETEATLRKSEERYRRTLDITGTGYVVIDTYGTVIDANNTYLRMTMFDSLEEIRGRSVLEWTAPEAKESNSAAVTQTIREGFIRNYETIYLRRDGSRLNISINAMLESRPEGPCLIALCTDITEKKKQLMALRQSDTRLKDIIECTTDWVWEIDSDGKYTFCNGRIFDVLGFTPEEILGRTPLDLMPPEEAERIGNVYHKLFVDRAPIVNLENTALSKDGRPVRLLTNGVPVFDSEGRFMGYRGADRKIEE